MPQIIPIKDLKNTSEISDMCHKMEELIYVTKNGYGDMVIMSMESYETMMGKFNLYRDIEISEKQIEADQVKDAKAALVSQKSSNVHPYPLSPELGKVADSFPFACDALMQKQGHEEETGQANKGVSGRDKERIEGDL